MSTARQRAREERAATAVDSRTVVYERVQNGQLVECVRTTYYTELPSHGTQAGRWWHKKRSEPDCDACREFSRREVAADRAAGRNRGGNSRSERSARRSA